MLTKYHTVYIVLLVIFASACKKAPLVTTEDINSVVLKDVNYTSTHIIKIVNLGQPGYRTVDLYAMESLVLKENPDLIILMCGTNDAFKDTFNDYRASLTKLIDDLRKKQPIDIMLLTPPPVVGNADNNSKINTICATIKAVAIEKKCFLADVNNYFNMYAIRFGSLLIGDGVHPNATGYTVLAGCVFKAYTETKLSKNTIVCFGDSITYGSFTNGEGTISGEPYPAQLYKLLNP